MKKRLVLGPKNKQLNFWAKNGWINDKKNSFREKNGKKFKKKERVFGPKMDGLIKKELSFRAKYEKFPKKMNGLRRKGQYQGPKRNNFQNNKKMIFWAKMDILKKKQYLGQRWNKVSY